MKITPPGSDAPLRVGKILCIGRNYAKHAAEMKSDLPSEPMVFLKPPTALIRGGEAVVLPPRSNDVNHEIELVVLVGIGGKDIAREDALDHVAGYAVGLDMTARDVQSIAKQKGHPWSVAKGFDTFAPLGEFVAASEITEPQGLSIELKVNGDVRQAATTADMIFPVDELIAYCSSIFTLEPGDLVYTGTPEGVGPVEDGDTMEAHITGLPTLTVSVRRDVPVEV